MASFGKIILFRTEDLVVGAGGENILAPGAFQPILGGQDVLIINPDADLDEFQGFAPVPFNAGTSGISATDRQNYRILTKNYRIKSDGSFSSERYEQFYRAGKRRKNLLVNFEPSQYSYNKLANGEFVVASDDGAVFNKNSLLVLNMIDYPNPPESLEFVNSIGQNYEVLANFNLDSSENAFVNHNLELSKPLTSNNTIDDEDINLQQFGIGDTLKITPVYNYYLKDYEQFYDSLPVAFINNMLQGTLGFAEEKSIPNFYYLVTLLASPDEYSAATSNANAAAPFTIEGILEGIVPSQTGFLSTSPLGFKLPREILVYEQQPTRERNSVVVITPSFYKNFTSEIASQKLAHPFYNEISIPIQKGGTVFRDLLKKAKMYEQLQYRAALQIKIINKAISEGMLTANQDITSKYNIFYTRLQNTENGLQVQFRDSQYFFPDPQDTGTPYTIAPAFVDRIGKIVEFDAKIKQEGGNYNFKGYTFDKTFIDLRKYLSRQLNIPVDNGQTLGSGLSFNLSKPNIFTNDIDSVTNPLTFYASDPESESNYIGGVIQNQANSILEYIFNKAKLNVFSIYNNAQNYSEILFFEVQKLEASSGNLIQTFILPNDPDVGDIVTYVDTQIKYGKEYIYKIYAHTLSIGNTVRRKESIGFNIGPSFDNGNGIFVPTKKVTFAYDNNYDIKILRAPYYNTEDFLLNGEDLKKTVNVDSPPVPPNILFYPFKNISNKIGFWFNIGLGEVKMIPETSLNSDNQANEINKYIQSVKINDASYKDGDPILYKTDDFGGKIEVYRITTLPKTYSEFKDNKIADVDVVGPRTLIDDIVPNQDYYYTFRHVDVHGLPSNPSPVYHLKMITTDSAMEADSVRVGVEGLQPILFNELIYLNGNSYDEEEVEKSFKKYLLIEPTLAQTYLSFNNFETGDVSSDFETAIDVKLNKQNLLVGKGGDDFTSVKNKKFKIRVTSKQTGRKIDLNVDFKNLSVIENYKE